jgi:nucleoid DNA-binding protein
MNKAELIDLVQKTLGTECSKAHAERAVNSVLESIGSGLKKDNMVQLVGFGTFSVKNRKPRTFRNPRTGEPVKVGASRTVGFKPGTALKSRV